MSDITFGIDSGWDKGVEWTDVQRKNYSTKAAELLEERGEIDDPPRLHFSLAQWLHQAFESGYRQAQLHMGRDLEHLERSIHEARKGIEKL